MFSLVNVVPKHGDAWHDGAADHTENDNDGYMMLINFGTDREEIFRMTVDNLCVGSYYLFSAYTANIVRKIMNMSKPNVAFEVQGAIIENQVLTNCFANQISDYDKLIWTKYSLPFKAWSSSVGLLIISNFGDLAGDDLVIDDIELRACSAVHCGICPPGQ